MTTLLAIAILVVRFLPTQTHTRHVDRILRHALKPLARNAIR